tara:strand:- start:200 stop:391 length:192 start_codon:yes stop_codon:yes gene_type:complete
MKFKDAKYLTNDAGDNCIVEITFLDDNDKVITTSHVPMDEENTHYIEILKQVKDGDLTIADAD